MQDLNSVRDVIGFPTRHKRRRQQRKVTIEIVTNSDEIKSIEVAADEVYPMIALPAFKVPAYITGEPYEGGIEMTGYSAAPGKRRCIKND